MLQARRDDWRTARHPRPKPGDVVVSERSARADLYQISVIPDGSDEVARHYSEAIERGGQLARRLKVDAWYTCDQTHYVPVARYRFSGR